jgi:hypothetical protein
MAFKLIIISVLFIPCLIGQKNYNYNNSAATFSTIRQSNKERIARSIVMSMSNQNFEDARSDFSDSLKARMKPGMLAGPWASMVNNAGTFKAILSAEENRVDGAAQVVVFCQFENANAVVQVLFNDDEKVTALYMKPVGR